MYKCMDGTVFEDENDKIIYENKYKHVYDCAKTLQHLCKRMPSCDQCYFNSGNSCCLMKSPCNWELEVTDRKE